MSTAEELRRIADDIGVEFGNSAVWHADAATILRAAAELDRLRAEVAVLRPIYEAVEKDECSPNYCAQQRGGLVHRPWLDARDFYKALEHPR